MLQKLLNYLDLHSELESPYAIHEEIEKSIIFKGTNVWILVFAIVIASVGLNINSTAVIIGAMLISPLMGPINGIGYSIATYDFPLFRRSLKNFGFAVSASLFASMMYFILTPVSSAHSELLARTAPTIYDVLIAMFGGLAGIVAISSKRKGNVIPGVAIATALMPPLCTAGYGLGTGQMSFFFGAMYLFTINSVFIALSALAVSRFFKFPMTTLIDASKKKSITRWVSLIIAITVLPSVYFGYRLVLNEKFNEKANQYVQNVTQFEGSYLLKHQIEANERTIELIYAGNKMTDQTIENIIEKSKDFNLSNPVITIRQGFSVNDNQFALKQEALKETEYLNSHLNTTLFQLEQSQQKIDSLLNTPMLGKQILKEAKSLYPDIITCSYAETFEFKTGEEHCKLAVVTFGVPRLAVKKIDKAKLLSWSKARLNSEKVRIHIVTVHQE